MTKTCAMKPQWAKQAGSLPPSVFRRYLAAGGWVQSERHKAWRYNRDLSTSDPAAQVSVDVPKRQDYSDYERRVVELVEILAAVEQRPATSILFDLGHPAADKLAFHFVSPQTQSGTIPITDACRIRDAQRRLLLSAAHSVVEPLSHHPRLARHEAVNFLNSCREAPSRAGSYIAPILIPVTPAVGGADLDDPFPRKVTRLLADALVEASDALDSGDDARLLEGAQKGLSSNLLGAFSELRPPGEGFGFVDVSFTWAPGRPAPEAPRRLRFDHSLFDPMAEAARVLRETTPSPGTTIEGYFARFEREPQDASRPGEVALLATVDDRPGTTKVYMTLSSDAYQQAWSAHLSAAKVRITGTLAKQGRRYVLSNPGDVVRVPDDEG